MIVFCYGRKVSFVSMNFSVSNIVLLDKCVVSGLVLVSKFLWV